MKIIDDISNKISDLVGNRVVQVAVVVALFIVGLVAVAPKNMFPCNCPQCSATSAMKDIQLQTVIIDGQEVLIPLEVGSGTGAMSVKAILATLAALGLVAFVLQYLYQKIQENKYVNDISGRIGRAGRRSGLYN